MRLPTDPGSKAKKKKELGVKIGSNERHFSHRDWQLPANIGVVILSGTLLLARALACRGGGLLKGASFIRVNRADRQERKAI
jgi:hypothetical protein